MQGGDAEDEGARTLALLRHTIELFNTGDHERMFAETFDPDVDYAGDETISALAGFPADARTLDEIRAVWTAFFEMWDEIRLDDLEIELRAPDVALVTCRLRASGGTSAVPIDAPFQLAYHRRGDRWVFIGVKRDREATIAVLDDHLAGRR